MERDDRDEFEVLYDEIQQWGALTIVCLLVVGAAVIDAIDNPDWMLEARAMLLISVLLFAIMCYRDIDRRGYLPTFLSRGDA